MDVLPHAHITISIRVRMINITCSPSQCPEQSEYPTVLLCPGPSTPSPGHPHTQHIREVVDTVKVMLEEMMMNSMRPDMNTVTISLHVSAPFYPSRHTDTDCGRDTSGGGHSMRRTVLPGWCFTNRLAQLFDSNSDYSHVCGAISTKENSQKIGCSQFCFACVMHFDMRRSTSQVIKPITKFACPTIGTSRNVWHKCHPSCL